MLTVFHNLPFLKNKYCHGKFKGKGRWVHWNDAISDVFLGDKNTKVQDIIVPTIDTVRYTYLMDHCITHGALVFSSLPHLKVLRYHKLNVPLFCFFFFCLSAQTCSVRWSDRHWEVSVCERETDEPSGQRQIFALLC